MSMDKIVDGKVFSTRKTQQNEPDVKKNKANGQGGNGE
jgi:hypothetical protein